ncbi:hypothetical protein GCM10009539_01840 [Cryptosporangium japonicum]|uniref:Uncharacterized protein n=1 Tax=Cryptosporangium japonicum TaxID=80872 RepID=A0ABN0TF56_9ACTN
MFRPEALRADPLRPEALLVDPPRPEALLVVAPRPEELPDVLRVDVDRLEPPVRFAAERPVDPDRAAAPPLSADFPDAAEPRPRPEPAAD